jgi:2-hydroxy-3-keto-5-methylthiopentenyl-1-phosphate phosphatase
MACLRWTMNILVSDFDGTLTEHDFFELVRRRWPLPPDVDPWNLYWAGSITHFEALARIFAGIRSQPGELEAMADATELDPGVAAAIQRLNVFGWEVVIASAGCGWYIERLLKNAGVKVTVHANPGRLGPHGELLMTLPPEDQFFSATTGVNKLAVVKDALNRAARVAFAGDGRPDLEPALLVSPELRYARGWLAQELESRGEPFQKYHRWSDIAESLTRT